jgi:sulfite reductase (ferredoxin)
LLDWGADEKFKPEIGIGECAGVKIDLVTTLLYESYEKVEEANYFLDEGKIRDAVYTAYSAIIQSAKSFLVKNGQKTNSKHQITEAFEAYYPLMKSKFLAESFRDLLNEKEENINQKFAREYVQQAEQFHLAIDELIKEIQDEK